MEKKNTEAEGIVMQLREFLMLPHKAWQRIPLFEFGANVSMMGIATSAIFLISLFGSAALIQNFGGLASNFVAVHWLDLMALKKVDELLAVPFGTLLSILCFAVAIVASIVLLRVTESIFDQQWGKIHVPTLSQRLPIYWLALTVVPSLLLLSVYVSFNFHDSESATFLLRTASKFIQFGASLLAFGFLYKVLIGQVISWRSSFFGAFWAALAFEAVKHAILSGTLFTTINVSQPIVTFLLFSFVVCIGFVFCSGAVVFGHHIAYVDQYRKELKDIEVPHQKAEPRPIREIALISLLEMARRFYLKQGLNDPSFGLDPMDVAKVAQTTPQRGRLVIRLLEGVGLIKIIQDGHREAAILKVHPDNLTLDEFLARLEQRVHSKSLNVPQPLQDASNQWFWQEYERALKDRFGSLTLRDLAELSMIMKQKNQAS